jgi:hypothetical protein
MKLKSIQLNSLMVTVGVLLAVFSRLMPHPANFAPMMAIGIFGGALFFKRIWAILIPIISIWLSDLVINNVVFAQYFDEFTWFYQGWYWQYVVYAIIPIISMFVFKKNISVGKLLGMYIGTALLFFLVSNFGVWASGTMYPKTGEGLLTCYAMGLPYIKGSLLSNLFYSSVLFGAYYLIENKTKLFVSEARHQWKLI